MQRRLLRKSNTELLEKIITVGIPVAGIIIGIMQFNAQKKENAILDFKKSLWQLRFSSLKDLTNVVSDISVSVTNETPAAIDTLYPKFLKVYYSSLPLIRDTQLVSTMYNYRFALGRYIEMAKDTIPENESNRADTKVALAVAWESLTKTMLSSNEKILNDIEQ